MCGGGRRAGLGLVSGGGSGYKKGERWFTSGRRDWVRHLAADAGVAAAVRVRLKTRPGAGKVREPETLLDELGRAVSAEEVVDVAADAVVGVAEAGASVELVVAIRQQSLCMGREGGGRATV